VIFFEVPLGAKAVVAGRISDSFKSRTWDTRDGFSKVAERNDRMQFMIAFR